jgi:MATE family multidrug resistance protein
MRGVKIRASHAFGEGRRDETYAILAAGMGAGLVLGAGVFVFGRDASWLFTLTKADPEIVPFGREFLRAITWGAPATCALAALIQHRQAIGDSRSPMVVQLGGNLFHGIAGYSLIYGKCGLPALGVVGAGYATTVTEMLEFAVLFALALRDGRGLVRQALSGARRALSEIFEVGAPTGIQFVLEVFAFTALTSILGSIASTEIAAHQIALMVLRGSFLPGIAISEAACVLVGQSLGARDDSRVPTVARAALKLGMGFMTACGVVFAVFGRKIAGAFTDDAAVVNVATHLLWVAAGFQVLDAISIVLRGVLRGAKDATFVAVAGVSISFLTIPTCAYALGVKCGMGALGGWLGFVAETALAAPILYARLRRAPWRSSLAVATAAGNEAEHEGEAREAA